VYYSQKPGVIMNWDAIGAIGEIVGAMAVVVSLAYLATQIRNQNREARAATIQQVLQNNADTISQLQDPELAAIWISGIDNLESLTEVERLRFVIYLTSGMRSFENAYFQWQNGRLDDETWITLTAVIRDIKSTNGFTQFLNLRRHHFRGEFVSFLEDLEPGDYSYIRKMFESD